MNLSYGIVTWFAFIIYTTVAKKSLKELRQLCFQLKDDVFASPKFGIAYNTESLEELLKKYLGTEMKMSDVKHPK